MIHSVVSVGVRILFNLKTKFVNILMDTYKYKNFINDDPILDLLKTQTYYKMDSELKGFNEDLLLENYTRNNKKIFCSKIFEKLGKDVIKIASDAFVMKTRKLPRHFKNSQNFTGDRYSLFTIEYSSIKTLKNGDISQEKKYYNFKNWMFKNECKYDIDNSFVIGRKYKNYNSFNYLARMPYTFEDLLERGDHHLETIKNKKIGVDIFPNMKNTSDYPYHNAKKIISNKYLELTSVKGISKKDRDRLVSIGVTSRCQIDLNRSEENFVNYKKLELPELTDNTIFIDFEILTSVYDDFKSFPESNTKNLLFNIGCVTRKWEMSWVSNSHDEEKVMFNTFISYINKIPGNDITLVHWTNIEHRIFEEKMKEYTMTKLNKVIKWLDLHEYFVKSDIYVKGCFNNKLKNVSRTLYKKGYIKTTWDNGIFLDGLGAMTGYILFLKNKDKTILDEIVKYNLVDCRVMLEIYEVILKDLNIPYSQ